ncbi:MAG: M23 family metallopeptidase, partial [Angelakisella sp.]
MQSRKKKRGINSIHRVGEVNKRTEQSSYSPSSALGAVLTIVQISLCVVLLVAVFTLQFLDSGSYKRAGELYRAAMNSTGEAVYVGALGTPITKEWLSDCTDKIMSGVSALGHRDALGKGGETPYLPDNLYLGRVLLSAKPVYPVYGTITSPFGVRHHPVSGKADFHTGLDIAAKAGESIYAVLPGVVSEVGSSDIYGNYIRISHAQGLESVYNHCSEILAQKGAVVRGGERIALV